jgi:hypothetical protein
MSPATATLRNEFDNVPITSYESLIDSDNQEHVPILANSSDTTSTTQNEHDNDEAPPDYDEVQDFPMTKDNMYVQGGKTWKSMRLMNAQRNLDLLTCYTPPDEKSVIKFYEGPYTDNVLVYSIKRTNKVHAMFEITSHFANRTIFVEKLEMAKGHQKFVFFTPNGGEYAWKNKHSDFVLYNYPDREKIARMRIDHGKGLELLKYSSNLNMNIILQDQAKEIFPWAWLTAFAINWELCRIRV